MQYDTNSRQAMLLRGREFIRVRREYVCDPDCLPSMIMACIEDGFTTRSDIIRTVPKFVGHSYAHVASVLDCLTGPDAKEHICFRDENKTYRLHPEPKRHTRAKRPAGNRSA